MHGKPLKEIIGRLERLEKAVFGSGYDDRPKRKDKGRSRDGLPAHILKLRDKGFFKEPRTATETHEKLHPTYHCEPDRVAMALLRLQKGKQLRKSSKLTGKKKRVAYVW